MKYNHISIGWLKVPRKITVIFISDGSTTDKGFRLLVKRRKISYNSLNKRSVDSTASPLKYNWTRDTQKMFTTPRDNSNEFMFPTTLSAFSKRRSIYDSEGSSESTSSTIRSTTPFGTTEARITASPRDKTTTKTTTMLTTPAKPTSIKTPSSVLPKPGRGFAQKIM